MSSAQIGAKNDSSVFWRGRRFPAREGSPSVSQKRQTVLALSWIVPRKLPLNSLIPKKVVDVKGAITIDAVVLLNFERECGKREFQRWGRTSMRLCQIDPLRIAENS